MFALVKTYIYLISSALFYPVVILLALLSLVGLLQLGYFVADGLERLRLKGGKGQVTSLFASGRVKGYFSQPVRTYYKDLRKLNTAIGNQHDVEVENLLQHHSLLYSKKLDRLMMMVRTGPGLGLIGTLIPMGTGLAALGQGDMSRLSADLVIAFTTTVVGMALGMLAFVLYTVRKRWLQEDVRYMEIASEVVMATTPLKVSDPVEDIDCGGQQKAEAA